MKKLFISLALALGFTGLVTAQSTAPTWPSPQPLNQYQLSNTTTAVGGFKDLGAEQPPFDAIIPLGSSLQAGTSLNDVYYYFPFEDGSPSFTATKSAEENGTQMEALPLTLMGFDFQFMEKPITGLIISALGGIFFTDEEAKEENQSAMITAKKAGTPLADLTASYAFLAYPYKGTDLVTATVQENVMPAQMTFGVDENEQKFILVQYNYVVDGTNTWKFQLKATEDGTVSCLVDALNRSEYDYNFALGVKRDSETLLLGGGSENSISVITDQTQGWAIPKPWNAAFPGMPALSGHTLSVAPKMAEVFNIQPEYATLTAEVSVAPDAVEKINAASSVVAFVTNSTNAIIRHDGTEKYKVGDKVAMQFPVVYEGKPALTKDNNTFTINATGLTPGSTYYLFLCTGSEADGTYTYSTTPFAISEQFTMESVTDPEAVTAGTPNGNKIPLTIEADANFSLLVVKSTSAEAMIGPQGKLSVGDTYEYQNDYTGKVESENRVIAILAPGTKTYDLEMTAGEATYVHIFTVANPDTDGAGYSNAMVMTPAYLPGSLPLAYTFASKDVIDNNSYSETMPILPPGMSTSTVLPDDTEEAAKIRSSAFFARPASDFDREIVYLTSAYYSETDFDDNWNPIYTLGTNWPDVIAPAFSGVAKVQATFRVKMYTPGMMMGSSDPHTPAAGDSVRIEYSLNDGDWQTAGLFTNANFPDAEAGIYPLTVDFACAKTDVVRIRYSYRTTTPNVYMAIVSYEFLEGRDCETPTDIQMVVDGTTDKALALKWTDRNVPAAGNYTVYYQKFVEPAGDDEEGGIMPWAELGDETTGEETEEDVWETLEVKTTEALLRNLDANSTYSVKIQAVCKTEESYASNPVRLSTYTGMPYIEPLFFDFNTAPEGIKAFTGAMGESLKETNITTLETDIPESWHYMISSDVQGYNYEQAAIAVGTYADQAWLTLPTVYVRKTDVFFPKTLRFKANTFTYQATEHNIDLKDTDLRLYVLASTNGKFTWDDTVKGFTHADFIVETAETETADAAAVSGKELTVDLSQFEGAVSIAFYFHNPNKLEMPDYGIGGFSAKNAKAGEEEEEPAEPMFLEIFDLAFTYDDEPIWPVFNLKAEADVYDATLTWEGEGVVYGISYGPADAEAANYSTVYQNALEQDVQSIKLENLTADTKYKAIVTSYTDEAHTQASPAMTVEFTTLKEMFTVTVTITPENAGTIKGTGSYFVGDKVTLTAEAAEGFIFVGYAKGTDTVKEATFTFDMPGENVTYTAVFKEEVSNEELLKAGFNVSTKDGQLIVRNLNAVTVKDVDVYGLTGNRINRFVLNSREDLMLPIDAQRAILFVRLNTEQGVAIYKVYLQ